MPKNSLMQTAKNEISQILNSRNGKKSKRKKPSKKSKQVEVAEGENFINRNEEKK